MEYRHLLKDIWFFCLLSSVLLHYRSVSDTNQTALSKNDRTQGNRTSIPLIGAALQSALLLRKINNMAARILEVSVYALSLAEGYEVVRGSE